MAYRKFDSNVKKLKYKVLREVARHTWEGNEAFSVFNDIAKEVVRKDQIPMRCCIYKDRAIVAERIRIALGGDKKNPNIVEVIDIACDDCPQAGYVVTDMCRGCIAHQCETACHKNAIEYDEKLKAHINKDLCVECGRCASLCQYNAIVNFKRPCEVSCKVGAIHMTKEGHAEIDREKCTSCGACVETCPFGATGDKSFVTDVIKMLKASAENENAPKVHAIIAPAIAAQFSNVTTGQVVSAIKELGFVDVSEVAVGADMVALEEAQELKEADFMTTSCCPAFVSFIRNEFPELEDKISTTLSPMAMLGMVIKEKDPDSKVVFIGPCVAKKEEARQERVSQYIDQVMTFEELQALIDSRDLELTEMPESELTEASEFGRGFAQSGGVAEAVLKVLEAEDYDTSGIKTMAVSGLDKCKNALRPAAKGKILYRLLEGMACAEGCIGGAGCAVHEPSDAHKLAKSAENAAYRSSKDAVADYE